MSDGRAGQGAGRARALLVVAALCAGALAACAATPSPRGAERPGELLAPERIAALPAAQRELWTRYLERSHRERTADRAVMEAELRALGRDRWTPAPVGPALIVHDSMTAEWFAGAHARRTADNILSFQTPSGGWSKRLDFARPRQPGESYSSEGWSYVATLDNDATTEEIRFLAGAFRAHGDPRYREAMLRGIDYLLRAQFPGGCWPQVYPLQGGYHDAATLNDDAMVNALRLVRDVAEGRLEAVPERVRRRARASVAAGVDCLLELQVSEGGKRTVWAAQHDPLSGQPVKARAYEHPSLSGRESAAVLLFLMDLDDPGPRVVEAVEAGVAWLRAHAIHGLEYQPKGELVERVGAGPLWARFYELGTGRPIFSNRDGVVRYRWSELEDERRYGYAWYTDEPQRVLRRHERWARRHRAGAGTPP